ncbi:MAG TPA: redoxin family protein [Nocardioidaceae bacterium]|nr:redoxin family protein [Nocardioidaceae bacterium]
MRSRTVVSLLAGSLLVLGGCASTESQDAPGYGVGSDAAVSNAAADLAFTADTLDGASFSGETLEGKPAVLWFWAPWCPTCRAQAPNVSDLAEKYGDQVNVVGVGGLADTADIRDFATEVDGPIHLVDAEGAVWRHFGVTAQSTYLVLDADGVVVAEGYLDDQALNAKVAELAG